VISCTPLPAGQGARTGGIIERDRLVGNLRQASGVEDQVQPMRLRSVVVTFTLLLVLGLNMRPAEACGCDPLPLWARPGSAHEVFSGRLVAVRELGNSWMADVRIERSWKGSLGPSRVVSVRVDDSRRRMGRAAVGQRWMLFVTRYPKTLVTSDCSGSWRVTARTPLVDDFPPRPIPTLPGASLPVPSLPTP
jgi:hypothetical protein